MGVVGYKTPNIDRIAREGILFTDYSAENSCTGFSRTRQAAPRRLANVSSGSSRSRPCPTSVGSPGVGKAVGRLSSRVKLLHFALLDSRVGPLGQLAETLIRDHWKAIEDAIPPVVLPVQLEPDIRIVGERMGPVTVKPGALPLRIEVSQVLPVGQRLWVLLDVHAGPWKPGTGEAGP
jgi:hypothetical protein